MYCTECNIPTCTETYTGISSASTRSYREQQRFSVNAHAARREPRRCRIAPEERSEVGSFSTHASSACGNGMDRLDAMQAFVVAVDEGSLAAAGRKLGRSPAAISRAIAFLEEQAGSKLLYRTTRSIKLSEEGERYVASCRRVLTEIEEVDTIISGKQAVPRGTLSLTAGMVSGEKLLLPTIAAFLDA